MDDALDAFHAFIEFGEGLVDVFQRGVEAWIVDIGGAEGFEFFHGVIEVCHHDGQGIVDFVCDTGSERSYGRHLGVQRGLLAMSVGLRNVQEHAFDANGVSVFIENALALFVDPAEAAVGMDHAVFDGKRGVSLGGIVNESVDVGAVRFVDDVQECVLGGRQKVLGLIADNFFDAVADFDDGPVLVIGASVIGSGQARDEDFEAGRPFVRGRAWLWGRLREAEEVDVEISMPGRDGGDAHLEKARGVGMGMPVAEKLRLAGSMDQLECGLKVDAGGFGQNVFDALPRSGRGDKGRILVIRRVRHDVLKGEQYAVLIELQDVFSDGVWRCKHFLRISRGEPGRCLEVR